MTPPSGSDYRGMALIGTAVGEIVIPTLAGVWVDRTYDTGPWGVLVGAVLGTTAAVTHLLYLGRSSTGGGPPPPDHRNP